MNDTTTSRGLVAIVGRPNVGKSTLYNRLVQQRQAIVDDQPGVTRDRLYGHVEWLDECFTVVDTGGYVPETDELFAAGIRHQVELALAEADLVLFVVDARSGLTPADEELAQIFRRRGSGNVLLVINKVDDATLEPNTGEFYGLGLEQVFPVSASSGRGTGELLDHVVERLRGLPPIEVPSLPRLAVVGRPNVGKSSFINALMGQERSLVTPVAGTTRDSLYTRYTAFGFDYFLVDTAGLRRKARVHEDIEFYSTMRSLRAIDHCDVALLMIDATQGIEAQDLAIFRYIVKQRKCSVVLANKWDLVDKADKNADRKLLENIRERLRPNDYVPILFTSTVTRHRLIKTLDAVRDVLAERDRKIPTHQLNDDLLPILQQTPPPAIRGKLVRVKFVTQVDGPVPTFLLFCNHPTLVKEPYKRFLENRIRQLYGFGGCPLQLVFKEK